MDTGRKPAGPASPPGEAPAPAGSVAVREISEAGAVHPLRTVRVRMDGPEAPPVDVTLKGRDGAMQVTVRSPNPALNTLLREDLDALVRGLDRVGIAAELVRGAESVREPARDPLPQRGPGDGHPQGFHDNGRRSDDQREPPRPAQPPERETPAGPASLPESWQQAWRGAASPPSPPVTRRNQ